MPAAHHSVFTGRMPFLSPNQQRQSAEGKLTHTHTPPHDGIKNSHNEKGAIELLQQFCEMLVNFQTHH